MFVATTVSPSVRIPPVRPQQSPQLGCVIIAPLQKLPEKYRVVLHLFYFEDMSVDQICKPLNMKATTVKVQLMRGREMMKDKLKEEEYYD